MVSTACKASASARARCGEKKERKTTTKPRSSRPSPPPPPTSPTPSRPGAPIIPSYSPATLRKRNGVGAAAGKNASLPIKIMKEMMTRPEDRGDIRTYVQVHPTTSSPKQQKQKQKQKKQYHTKQLKHDTPEEDDGNDLQQSWSSSSSWWTLESPSSPRSTSSPSRRKFLSNKLLRHMNKNKDTVVDDDTSVKSAPTVVLPGTSSPANSSAKRRTKKRHSHARGGINIKLPFGFDDDDDANTSKRSSSARTKKTHGAEVKSVKNETKNKRKCKTKSSSNRKNKTRKQKKKSMKKVNSSSETSVTTQSLSKLDSSSTSLHLSLKDEDCSPLDRWGGQSSKNFDHQRQDYNAISPPSRPVRRSITPPAVVAADPSSNDSYHEPTATKPSLTTNVSFPTNDKDHGSLSETPFLDRCNCDDDTAIVVTTAKDSIDQDSHHTSQSSSDTCVVVGDEDFGSSDRHKTAKSAKNDPIFIASAPVQQSPDAATHESNAAINHQEESDSGKSVQLSSPKPETGRPSVIGTPKQEHDTTMSSLYSSPTSVLQSFFHLPITSPTVQDRKSVEKSPSASPTENDHSVSEEIVVKTISPMEQCGSLSSNHTKSSKKDCNNSQRPKVDTSEKRFPTKTTQRAHPCSGADTSENQSADAEIVKSKKIEPCRIATKKVSSQRDNSYASFFASSFGSIDLNDVHDQKGATHPSFSKIAVSRPRPLPPSEEHALSPIVQERKKLHLLLDTQTNNGKTQRRSRKSTGAVKSSIPERDIVVSVDGGRRRSGTNPTRSPKKELEKINPSRVATKHKQVAVDRKNIEERGRAPLSPYLNSLKKVTRVSTTDKDHNIYTDKISTLRSTNLSPASQKTTPESPAKKTQPRLGSTMALSMAKLWEEKLIPSISPSHQHQDQHPSQQKQSRCQSSMLSSQRSPPKSQHGCGRSRKVAAKWESAVFNPRLMT